MQGLSRGRRSRSAASIIGTCAIVVTGLSLASTAAASAGAGVPGYSVSTLQIPEGAGGLAVDPATATAYMGTLGYEDVISEATGTITDQISISAGPGIDTATLLRIRCTWPLTGQSMSSTGRPTP
jgi:hypothetical protein